MRFRTKKRQYKITQSNGVKSGERARERERMCEAEKRGSFVEGKERVKRGRDRYPKPKGMLPPHQKNGIFYFFALTPFIFFYSFSNLCELDFWCSYKF